MLRPRGIAAAAGAAVVDSTLMMTLRFMIMRRFHDRSCTRHQLRSNIGPEELRHVVVIAHAR